MRIIQIIDVRWYNACADFAIKQAQALAHGGHDVLLLANPGSPPAIKAREAGLNVSEEIDFTGISRVLTTPSRLRKIASSFNADVIFAHRGESHVISALAARGLKTRVARFRGDIRLPRGDVFNRWLTERMTDGIAVSTELLKLRYEKSFRMNGHPVRVIYPGIDSRPFDFTASKEQLKSNFGLDPGNIVVGIVGRLSPVKGHRYFIEACKLVSIAHPRTQFVIAGGDAQLNSAQLRLRASALGVPNMRFFGIADDIVHLISSFDIGVVASIGSEMICRVLLEYFAAGLPVVATSINQISELMLQSQGGVLVPPADAVSMARAINGLIEDDERRSACAQQGNRWVQGRSLETLGRETEDFLNEVINA